MRCDQHIGLSKKAKALVRGKPIKVGVCERVYNDGRPNKREDIYESTVKEVDSGKYYVGAFSCDRHPLIQYTLPDGRVLREFIQAEPWSSGPCYFLALEEKIGEEWVAVTESLWTQSEIDRA